MAIRLIHTADVHLDACYTSARFPAGFGNRRRQGLRDVFHAIVTRAGAWPADALLIAGDLFEAERVSRDTLAFLRAEFGAVPHVPVFIAPGNHDPYVPGSPYAAEPWPDNVLIFSRPEWTSQVLPGRGLTVHGVAFDGPDISQNPFGTLAIETQDGIHVAVAHGSERAHQPPSKAAYAPFDAADAAAAGLAYLALGHFHTLTPLEGPFPTRMYYSGAPEGHGFGELGPHHYLEVEIADGGEVRVSPVPCSRAVYVAHTLDCSGFTTTQHVVSAIRALPRVPDAAQILRVTLGGACVPAIRNAIPAVEDALAGDFEYLELLDATEPIEDYDGLAREQTSLGVFLSRINAEIHNVPDAARRRLLERAREVGLAAFRGRDLPLPGVEGD